jgi:predicted metalloprotease
MRLDDRRESQNIENRRGEGGGFGLGGGGGMGASGMGGLLSAFLPLIISKFGIGGIAVVGLLFFVVSCLPQMMASGPAPAPRLPQAQAPATPGAPTQIARGQLETEADRFVAKVLATTEDSWGQVFAQGGQKYPAPTLVLFQGGIRSACGSASSASGPFYCPADRKVYLDTAFFDQLARQFGAPGDFAAAYVIAHEVGHHIQNITGTLDQTTKLQARMGERERNAVQVRVELQADCYAGVWAARNKAILDEDDFAEGVRAAQSIGDDTLMASAGRRVVPDSFTHGSAEQRVRWLTRGFRSGDPAVCDTFSVPEGQL